MFKTKEVTLKRIALLMVLALIVLMFPGCAEKESPPLVDEPISADNVPLPPILIQAQAAGRVLEAGELNERDGYVVRDTLYFKYNDRIVSHLITDTLFTRNGKRYRIGTTYLSNWELIAHYELSPRQNPGEWISYHGVFNDSNLVIIHGSRTDEWAIVNMHYGEPDLLFVVPKRFDPSGLKKMPHFTVDMYLTYYQAMGLLDATDGVRYAFNARKDLLGEYYAYLLESLGCSYGHWRLLHR